MLRVWDLPAGGDAGQWLVSGPGTARVVFLDRAGHPLLDREIVPGDGTELPVTAPPGAARAVVGALGAGTEPGRSPVCGWQAGSQLIQVAPAALLARGATVHLPAPLVTRRDGRRTSQALVPAATAVAGQPSCTTCLPAAAGLVLVIVDGDPAGHPEVSVDGAATGEPTLIAVGRRLNLLYPVTAREPGHPLIRVRVAPHPDAELAGVLSLPGSPGEWARALAQGSPRLPVPEGPVSPNRPVTVRYQIPTTSGEPA
jgi:hypothetical protein